MTHPVAHNLALREVSKHYGAVSAVDRVSLDVPRGQFLTLLGPSGSGKTTLLMIIAGFVEPTAGDVLVDGTRITHLPPEQRNFGMVFQGYALFPHLTVFDNVAFPLTVRRVPRAHAAHQIRSALDLVQLVPLADRYPRQLSGGQQQRVALARALVFTPDVLLLDEPLSALDKKLRAELQWELKQVHQRVGTTFVYVTHDQEEALSMSDQIAIIRDGRIVQSGQPRHLYERPATRFVADFLGKSNFISGRVVAIEAGRVVYEVAGCPFVQARGGGAAVSVGSEIVVALRPEKIDIRDKGRPGAGVNGVTGTISAWNYHGTSFHVLVETDALGELMVTAPAWRSEVEPEVGRAVHLGWDADAAGVVAPD
jgi:putative spermidine/putrescine transport system ATP-binding protein